GRLGGPGFVRVHATTSASVRRRRRRRSTGYILRCAAGRTHPRLLPAGSEEEAHAEIRLEAAPGHVVGLRGGHRHALAEVHVRNDGVAEVGGVLERGVQTERVGEPVLAEYAAVDADVGERVRTRVTPRGV